jgi:tetrahydromethanopterin S-methyltransferase subunit F
LEGIDFGPRSISLETLQSNISFQAVIPDSTARTLENLKDIKDDQIRLEKLETLGGYSNIYIVELNLSNKLGLNAEQGRMLLDGIILEYKEQLIDKYGDEAVLGDVFAPGLDLDQYDYIQAAEILNGQLERMEVYVDLRMPRTDVHSVVTGLNASDIASALDSIRTADMERLYTMIGAFNLTKDVVRASALYEQMAEAREETAAQYREEANSVRAAITSYKKDQPTVVLGEIGAAPVNLTSESPEYNRLVTQYVEAATLAVNAAEEARYYRAETERVQASGALSPEMAAKAAEAEVVIESLRDKLVDWTAVINRTMQDYYSETTYQRYAEQLMPARNYALDEGPSLLLAAAAGLALGLVLGVLIVLFRAYMKEDIYVVPARRKEVGGSEID